MIQDEARTADRLARAAHRYQTWAARLMSERTGPCGGEITCDDEAGVVGSRNTGAGKRQVIEVVGACATDKCGSARKRHQTGTAGIGAIIGPVSSDRMRKRTSVEGGG